MPYLFILVELLLINVAILGQEFTEWKPVKTSGNIKVYVQRVPDSELKRVKVETIFESGLGELVAIIKDADNHKNWVFFNESAEIFDEIDNCNWKYYGVTDTPWPVTSRDVVTSVSLSQNKIDYSVTITSVAIPDLLPEYDDYVRVKHINATWLLNPIGNGTVHINFEIEIDPGGNIPIWLVNFAVTKGPLKTIEGLMKVVNSKKYKNIKLDYIEEFVL